MINQDQISGLLFLIDAFRSIPNEFPSLLSSGKINVNEIPEWYPYYEITMGQLFYEFINITNMHSEIHDFIFTDNPAQAALDIANQDTLTSPPKNLNLEKFVAILYALIKTYESVLYHQQTIHQLLKKIQTGLDTTDKLLHKIIQIDKTAIYCKPIQQRIHQAQITGDEKFFKKLATAFKPRVLPEPSQDATLTFIIFFLLDIGEYQKMSEAERFELLIQFKQPHIDDASFKRKLYRIKNLYV
ncbi:MAG: hypothetical protein IBX55_22195 [Methyloprofundus sp.]|nr:hypothetical protein [Methyloprofundus sp.]